MSDFIIELVKVVVPIVATALAGLGVWAVKDAKKMKLDTMEESKEARKASDETILVVKLAMVTLLRQKMVETHRKCLVMGQIHMSERANFFEMHSTYTMLGGNGVTSHLTEDIKKLPVVE